MLNVTSDTSDMLKYATRPPLSALHVLKTQAHMFNKAMRPPASVVVVVFITVTCTANGGHWVPPGGLQAYSLPQPWLCRAPKVRRGGEGDACVSMETCNIKIHNREHRFSNSVPISGP